MTQGPSQRPLKVLYLAAEVSPFSKVGGLADVAASLPKALAALGHDVRIIAPDHGGKAQAESPPSSPLRAPLRLIGQAVEVQYTRATLGSTVPLYLVGNTNFFSRAQVYGEPDDLLRYQLFSLAALEAPKLLGWRPDILHCNDWHTALLPHALRNRARADAFYQGMASVLTIHNLRYRGPDDLADLLMQGIYYADAVTTVSPTYAREITTPQYGEGLHQLLLLRRDRLYGIINGIDPEVYDPMTDPALAARYDADSLEEKVKNKEALQAKLGLTVAGDKPLAGLVSRLVDQKGIDLLVAVLDRAVTELGLQFAVLGSGDSVLQQQLLEVAAHYPQNVQVTLGFDPPLAQLIYGGADFFLMPSLYEPCGLGQLIAMRYGTVPVVRATGGLADTVLDLSPDLASGTGFTFGPYQAEALFAALARAVAAFRNRTAWREVQRRCMAQDHSWSASARQYEAMYYDALMAKA